MNTAQITRLRLRNLLIEQSGFHSPVEVVGWLGAVQSQEYSGAKWAVGQRAQALTDASVEAAFNAGDILRTHVLRPTWHFVTPADIRWMLDLTAPRIKASIGTYHRRLGLDQSGLLEGSGVIEKALQDGKHRTRPELEACLVQAGVISSNDDPLRCLYVILNAELDGIVCSGARRGNQHTYALLEERAPNARRLAREEGLGELARRYFSSRGPAALKDFIWWSGLSGSDAKAGLEMIRHELIEEKIDDRSYWLDPSSQTFVQDITPSVHLLPNYDEYVVSYANRSAIFDPGRIKQVDARGNLLFNHTIVIDGQIAGAWKRTLKKNAVEITPNLFLPLSEAQVQALAAEIGRYSQFLGLPIIEVQ